MSADLTHLTLHEAIEQAIIRLARPATAREILDYVHRHNLYVQQAGTPLTIHQICARIRHYPKFFSIDASARPFLYDLVGRERP
ncbi:MAG: hypothetical protein M0Z66_12465 [Thermaerobacter sp.]|nr:hypothetical protein [Thermaerobacter sp.]